MPVPGLRDATERLTDWLGDWAFLAKTPAPADLDRWVAGHRNVLYDLAGATLPLLSGDSLCHGDLRSDNILINRTGRMMLTDWPHALRGARWLDAALLGIEIPLG